jgi:hypothetical protein
MTTVDWIGSFGVAVTLIAFVLNLLKITAQDSLIYAVLNFVGGVTACIASMLLHYFPFIILEAIWSLASLVAVINYFRDKSAG